MDAESLAQVEQIVTTAVSGVEGRLRNEVQGLGALLRQELAEKFEEAERHSGALSDRLGASLRQELAEKFEEAERHSDQQLAEKFEEAERHSGALFDRAERHSGALFDRLGASLRQELAEKFEEAERHSGALFEEMGHRLDLVVEGFEGLRQGQTALRQMIEHESLEMQSLMKLSYRQLQDRVETLEQRVQIVEKRLGLSN